MIYRLFLYILLEPNVVSRSFFQEQLFNISQSAFIATLTPYYLFIPGKYFSSELFLFLFLFLLFSAIYIQNGRKCKVMSIRCLEFSKTDTEIYVHIGSVISEHLAEGGRGVWWIAVESKQVRRKTTARVVSSDGTHDLWRKASFTDADPPTQTFRVRRDKQILQS